MSTLTLFLPFGRIWVVEHFHKSTFRGSSHLAGQFERWRNPAMWLVKSREVDLWAFALMPNSKDESPPKYLHGSTFWHFLVPRVWPLEKSLGASKTETQTLVERLNFFSIKYSKSNKKTLIIYFNELLSWPLERSLGFGLSVRFAKCEEALSVGGNHIVENEMVKKKTCEAKI